MWRSAFINININNAATAPAKIIVGFSTTKKKIQEFEIKMSTTTTRR
jgi:hypothetical protein